MPRKVGILFTQTSPPQNKPMANLSKFMKDVNRMARNSFRLVEETKVELEFPNL